MNRLNTVVIIVFTICCCVCSFSYKAEAGAKKEISTLTNELMKFKDEAKFHQVGFGQCCKYYKWLKKVELLKNNDSLGAMGKAAVGYLEMMGIEYMKTKGKENDFTKFCKQTIKETLE
jgi:hypothetical protein